MRLLLISSSNVHGYGYLDHAEPTLRSFVGDARKIAFVPFAKNDHAAYIAKVRERLARMNMIVAGPESVGEAEAIFVGGGNTFRLLKALYDRNLLSVIRERARSGVPYIGSSAGSVIAAPTMGTTNDMPIVEPPSFDALGLVSFQLNCHYLDAEPQSSHQGETREERILEFHEENARPVVGLREGTMLRIEDASVTLVGERTARIFRRGETAVEAEPGPIEALLA